MARKSSFGALASTRLRVLAIFVAIALPLVVPTVAAAQSVPPPATYYSVDANNVDVVSGAYFGASHSVSVGQPGMGGLVYTRTYDSSAQYWRDSVTGTINSSGANYIVTLMDASERFTLASGVYSSTEGRGGTLTFASGTNEYTYTTASGAVAIYSKNIASLQPTQANEGRVTQVTMASGERLTFTYTELRTPALPATPTFLAHRIQSVTNNLGYQLNFKYEDNDPDASGINLLQVMAINNASAYCAPTANGCALSGWPTLTFGVDGTAITVTDATSRTSRYAMTSGRITGVRWPSSGSDDVTITYGGSRVSSIVSAAGIWSYGYESLGTGYSVAAVSYPGSTSSRVYTISDTSGRVASLHLGEVLAESYQYDGQGRLTRITYNEGNYVAYTYDARGNIAEARQVAKSGSGLSDIVTTAAYDTTCSNVATCNQPNSTTDARGFRTDYTYDTTHGGVITATAPAPSGSTPVGSGTRPQTRYAYTQLFAYYHQSSGGGVTVAPTGVYRPTSSSACATTSSCSGGSDETSTSIGYGSTGVANNRLPLTMSSGAGDGSLTAVSTNTFNDIGNLTSADGPLSGDTTTFEYDAARRRLGAIGPDPDGGGSLLNGAVRYSYDGHGWVNAVERGTAASGVWANFSALERLNVAYDGAGRRSQQSFVAGGSIHAVTQYSYDTASRVDCVAVRMNPSEFGSLPSSACTLDTEGTNGPDRITRYAYDLRDRITNLTNAYGTSEQQVGLAQTYTNNGQISTLQDANGNVTTYEYDGFDRTRKIRFPLTSGGGSSTTDYEQYTYDANSNVTQDRRRDGATITYAYDNLNRASTITPSTGSVVSYAYDNFARMTQAAFSGHTLTFGYDQLSRNISAGGPLGTVSYQYDLAGQRTRVTWPDSFYARYDYDLTGAVTAIRENGASSGVGVLAAYAYDNLARRTSVTRGNGTTTTYDYDAAGRLEDLAQNLASSANDVTFNFTYNASGQATTRDRSTSNSGYVWPQPANNTQNSTANGLNQIAQLAGTNFTYDSRGNLTSTGAATYGYDVYNRLASAGSATLSYDPGGRLYQTTSNGTTVTARLQYDGADLIAEYNGSNALLRRYVHGPGIDEPIVWYEGSGTTDRRWLHQDQLGSVVAASDSSGVLIGSPNTFDEYGVPGSSNLGRFQYTGQTWLADASLYYYKARAYAPSLGRFLQSDPILQVGGMNIYAYVGNDPVNGRDPSGLQDDPAPGRPCPEPPASCGTTTITGDTEDWVRNWRSAMDRSTQARLDALFAWLANYTRVYLPTALPLNEHIGEFERISSVCSALVDMRQQAARNDLRRPGTESYRFYGSFSDGVLRQSPLYSGPDRAGYVVMAPTAAMLSNGGFNIRAEVHTHPYPGTLTLRGPAADWFGFDRGDMITSGRLGNPASDIYVAYSDRVLSATFDEARAAGLAGHGLGGRSTGC